MLVALAIRDVVLIDRLELNFSRGLSVLTGETGAGKSILLDALGLALGGRGDARLVRPGASQAVVTAHFAPDRSLDVWPLLTEQGLADGDGELVVRRQLAADGRSRAFVNDQPVSVALLKRLGEALVEIHGQFESQRLLDPASHRELLDAYGGLKPMVFDVGHAWRDWRAAIARRQEAEARLLAARRDEDFLRHALEELEKLAPQPGEEAELAVRRAVLQNGEKLGRALAEATAALQRGAGAGSCAEGLREALRVLQRVAATALGPRIEPIVAGLDRALCETLEAEAQLERLIHDSDLDPAALEQVEERLFALRAAARKHGVPADQLDALRGDLARRLAVLDDSNGEVARCGREERAAADAYRRLAVTLSERRRAVAAAFDRAVAAELEPLRLGKARFTTRVEPLTEDTVGGASGRDRVVFEVSTNPGMPAGPLAKIASGGELARLMLALKVVLAGADGVPVLVFDEVDAGIGGAVAAAVGERLARLAETVQVLVVTHSPQVAARGHTHWRIAKSAVAEGTRTGVEMLDGDGRREEIARMLAGARVTDEARAAALSLLVGSAA
ncbi:MAG: DNA repair protein RecN [Rhodospirillales bacterium]|jgi:DNA repair protein RecN (Recombination protein N)|nr:DNA repair protein RecN [Rhodospirillales bacterium]